MNKLTAFTPISNYSEYEIIIGPAMDFNESNKQIKLPNELEQTISSKKESKIEENDIENKKDSDQENENEQPKKEKKYWSFQQKQFAVTKARLIGLTKAAKYLRITNPETYGDLSPSTLQYWVKNDRQYR